jgi:hypothetical protein
MSEQSIINPQFFERRADRPFEFPLAKVSDQTFPNSFIASQKEMDDWLRERTASDEISTD